MTRRLFWAVVYLVDFWKNGGPASFNASKADDALKAWNDRWTA